jgi:hypothetical protein
MTVIREPETAVVPGYLQVVICLARPGVFR